MSRGIPKKHMEAYELLLELRRKATDREKTSSYSREYLAALIHKDYVNDFTRLIDILEIEDNLEHTNKPLKIAHTG